VGRNRYQSTGIALVLGRWTLVFNFKGTPSWILQKNILPPLEPNLLEMLGRIVKRCILFMKFCTLSSANSTGARECAAHHGMALEPFSANWLN
jgi:trehalose-6-phosphatase